MSLSHPTPYLLYVTQNLYNHVCDNPTHTFFVDVRTLLSFHGNVASIEKTAPLLQSIKDEEEELHLPLPIFVVNCVYGSAVLIEGNNRLEVFRLLNKAWFPISVRVEDCKHELKPDLKAYDIPEEYNVYSNWYRKKQWTESMRLILMQVFGFRVLDLDGEYNEESFYMCLVLFKFLMICC